MKESKGKRGRKLARVAETSVRETRGAQCARHMRQHPHPHPHKSHGGTRQQADEPDEADSGQQRRLERHKPRATAHTRAPLPHTAAR
jgi:hypothetical protein